MQPWPNAVPAKQHHPEKTGFEEEGGQHFVGQQRAGNAAGKLRETAPVGAKLVGHHQAGDDAHAKIDGENLRPELIQRTPERVMGF